MADQAKLHVNDAHAVNVDRLVRRGNENQITFHEDVGKDDTRGVLEDARHGTR